MAVAAALSLDDVLAARRTIGDRLHRTPMLRSATLSKRAGVDVHLKAELFQRTGSFKPRGVLNKLASLTDEEKARGVIAISAGNHAQALAYAAAQQGIDALVVMWQTASPMKIAAARGYGATVDTEAADIPAAFERLDRADRAETGRTLVHPYDDPLVMAGQGTVGLEILEDVPDAEVVLVPVGGGGLVSGIATAVKGLKPDARVIAIEPERSCALHASMAAGEPVTVEAKSIADGLNGPYAGPNCVAQCLRGSASSRCSSPRRTSRTRSASCTARTKLAVRGRRAPPRRPRSWPGKCRSRAPAPSPPSSREATWHPKRPLLFWPGDEAGHPSRVRPGDGHLLVRQHVPDAVDEARAPRRDLLRLPPVLHRQAEARRHRRPRRALPAPAREGLGAPRLT